MADCCLVSAHLLCIGCNDEPLFRHLETRKDQDFANICYTLHVGRTDFNHRRYLVCRNKEEAIAQLSSPHSPHVITTKHKDYPRKVVLCSRAKAHSIKMADCSTT